MPSKRSNALPTAIRRAILDDYALTDESGPNLAAKHNISDYSVYNTLWDAGYREKGKGRMPKANARKKLLLARDITEVKPAKVNYSHPLRGRTINQKKKKAPEKPHGREQRNGAVSNGNGVAKAREHIINRLDWEPSQPIPARQDSVALQVGNAVLDALTNIPFNEMHDIWIEAQNRKLSQS